MAPTKDEGGLFLLTLEEGSRPKTPRMSVARNDSRRQVQ